MPKGRRVTVKIDDIDFVGSGSEQRLSVEYLAIVNFVNFSSWLN